MPYSVEKLEAVLASQAKAAPIYRLQASKILRRADVTATEQLLASMVIHLTAQYQEVKE